MGASKIISIPVLFSFLVLFGISGSMADVANVRGVCVQNCGGSENGGNTQTPVPNLVTEQHKEAERLSKEGLNYINSRNWRAAADSFRAALEKWPENREFKINLDKAEDALRNEVVRKNLINTLNKQEQDEVVRENLKSEIHKQEQNDIVREDLINTLNKQEQDEARNRLKAKLSKYNKLIGNWNLKELELVHNSINRIKDKKIRDWIVKNVWLERCNDPGQQKQLSPWAGNSKLIFSDSFFSRGDITDASRANLIAFEAGKAFWRNKQNELVQDQDGYNREPFHAWAEKFCSDNSRVIREMAETIRQRDKAFTSLGPADFAEPDSTFAYLFHAQAFGLKFPTQNKFKVSIAPLLQDKK